MMFLGVFGGCVAPGAAWGGDAMPGGPPLCDAIKTKEATRGSTLMTSIRHNGVDGVADKKRCGLKRGTSAVQNPSLRPRASIGGSNAPHLL